MSEFKYKRNKRASVYSRCSPKTDRGIVIVLDKRLTTKQYGRLFMESLPSPTISQGLLGNLPEQAAKWLSI